MITRRFFISGIVTTAAVASASTITPSVGPQLYATVYGVSWDFEPIAHEIYEPMSIAHFGGTADINKFREVTEFVHAFPVQPMPKPINVQQFAELAPNPLKLFNRPVKDNNGITNIADSESLRSWAKSLRPDLEGPESYEWFVEQINGKKKADMI